MPWAGIAQLVERVICNHDVGGSNPSAGTISFSKTLVLPGWSGEPFGPAAPFPVISSMIR